MLPLAALALLHEVHALVRAERDRCLQEAAESPLAQSACSASVFVLRPDDSLGPALPPVNRCRRAHEEEAPELLLRDPDPCVNG